MTIYCSLHNHSMYYDHFLFCLTFCFSLWVSNCCWSVKSCPTLCDPMNDSTPGFPVLHYLPELTQTHFHWVGDAIQPSHPLSSISLPALNLSQHQGLLQWVNPLHQVAKILELQLQHQSFQWILRADFLQDWSPCKSKRFSRVFSRTTVQSINSSALSLLYGPTLTPVCDYCKNHSFDWMDLCRQSWCLCFLEHCLSLPQSERRE